MVNPASGGNHYTCGDMLDLHNYPQPEMYLYDAQRATVLGGVWRYWNGCERTYLGAESQLGLYTIQLIQRSNR